MNGNDNSIERFIQTILEIQNNTQKVILTEAYLESVASDSGLSPGEWESIRKLCEDHTTRGDGFLKYDNYDDAIEAYKQALAIMPHKVDLLYNIAVAHKKRWQQSRKDSDKNAALRYANQCIQIAPTFHDAIILISTLKKKAISPTANHRKAVIVVVVVAVIVALLVFFTLVRQGPVMTPLEIKTEQTTFDNQPIHSDLQYDEVQLDELDNKLLDLSKQNEKKVDESSPYVEVIFDENKFSEGLKLKLQTSEFNNYETSYSYSLKGNFEVEGIEISKLKIKVDMLDKNGKVVNGDLKDLLSTNSPTVRPGNVLPIDFLSYNKTENIPDVAKVRLSVVYAETNKAAAKYAEGKLIKTEWTFGQPANYDVEIRERFIKLSGYDKNMYSKIEFEVKNTGVVPIQQLKLEIVWYNKKDEMKESKTTYVNTTSNAKLMPGETKLHGGTWSTQNMTTADYGYYKIQVVEIE